MVWRVVLFAAGCAAQAAPSPLLPSAVLPRPAAASPWHDVANTEATRAAVARLRELAWTSPVPVHGTDQPTFDAWLAARGVTPHAGVNGAYSEGAVWLAGTDEEALAHELVHALEAQHALAEPERSEDEGDLAAHTLHEGVALAVARAVVAERGGLAPRRAIAERGVELESVVVSQIGQPFAARFPYVVGAGLAGALYTTGGAPLWNAAERRPPRSLVETLHPSLYLAGFSDGSPVATRAGAQGDPLRGWQAQLLLERRVGPDVARAAMNAYRGGNTLHEDGAALAFADDAAKRLHTARVVGGHVLVLDDPNGSWRALPLPALGVPPLPDWKALAPAAYPLQRDPAASFVLGHGEARALGLAWHGVTHVERLSPTREVVSFGPHELVSTLALPLNGSSSVQNALTLLVQSFVASEVARIDVREERSTSTPAGTVYTRVVELPEEPATVAVLPRCDDRYALAFVAFERELSPEAFRQRLTELRPFGEDALCTRLRREDGHDFTPPAPSP